MSGITAEEILKELEKIESESADGFTVVEMAEHIGASASTARSRLKKLIKAGVGRHNGFRAEPDISGKTQHIPVYTLKK